MKKKLVSVILAVCCFVVVFAGCVEQNIDKIVELQEQINGLQTRVESLETALEEADGNCGILEQQYYNLSDENRELREIIKKYLDGFDIQIPNGRFTLSEAYGLGLFKREELISIANYYNNEIKYSEELDNTIGESIKELEAERIRNDVIEPITEAKADGVMIIKYLGCYSGCYVVKITNVYELHPADVPDYWKELDGVRFHCTGYDVIVVFKF